MPAQVHGILVTHAMQLQYKPNDKNGKHKSGPFSGEDPQETKAAHPQKQEKTSGEHCKKTIYMSKTKE